MDARHPAATSGYTGCVRAIAAILVFLGVACLLVAAVVTLFPQIRESSDDAAKRLEKSADTGKPPKVELVGDPHTIPWALIGAGLGLTLVGWKIRRATDPGIRL